MPAPSPSRSPAATVSQDISGWPPQFEMMKLEARPPDGGDWIPIFPAQLQAMAKYGNEVRATIPTEREINLPGHDETMANLDALTISSTDGPRSGT